MPRKKKEYSFALKINGEHFMSGDESSIGIIFNNLSGRNFADKPEPAAEHVDWLNYMEWAFKTPFPALAEVKMLSPENILLYAACIGDGLPRPDPVIGQSYMVKTCPPGTTPIWTQATLMAHNAATLTTRELFQFSAGQYALPVTRAEVMERVMPIPVPKQGDGVQPPVGSLAGLNGETLPIQVLESPSGFYLGTCNEEGPVSRESEEYWPTKEAAQLALAGQEGKGWTQRLEA